jgi:hypothetical protein
MYEFHAYENLGYFIIDVKKIKDAFNEWKWVKCIVNYELFKFLETIIISKNPFKHKQWLFSWTILNKYLKILSPRRKRRCF